MAGVAAERCLVRRNVAPVCGHFQQFFRCVLLDSLVCTAAGSLLLRLGAFSPRICSSAAGVFDPERLGCCGGQPQVGAGTMDEAYGPLLLADPGCSAAQFGNLLELAPATSGSDRGDRADRLQPPGGGSLRRSNGFPDFGATSWTGAPPQALLVAAGLASSAAELGFPCRESG